jgi:hypothetical protein
MKVKTILVLTVLVGACWATAPDGDLVPWTSSPKVVELVENVPYEIDSEANFSDRRLSRVESFLKRNNSKTSKKSKSYKYKNEEGDYKYKERENEHVYLFITSYEKCIDNRVNDFSYPTNVVVVCANSFPNTDIEEARKMARKINQKIFNLEEEKKVEKKTKKAKKMTTSKPSKAKKITDEV